jgi:O-antigen/teichoic acid export membrane protein
MTEPGAGPAAAAEETYSGRRLGREVLIYGLGVVFSRMASFIMLPVYTRLLTPKDYGLLQMLDMTLDVTAILVSAGVTMGVMRFYFKATTERGRREVLGSAFVLELGLNLLGTLVLCLGAGPIWRLGLRETGPATMVYVAAANFTLSVLSTVPLLQMQMERKALAYSVATFSRVVLQLTLNILFLVGFRWGVLGVLLSNLVSNVVIGGATAGWMLWRTGLAVSRAAIADLRRFGIPYQIATAATFILTFGDRFFLQASQGLAAVGIYSLAYQFGFLLDNLAATPFNRAWVPQRYQLASRSREFRDAKYNQGFLYLSLIVVTAAVGMTVFIRPVLQLMSDASFWPAARIVPVVVAAYVIQCWSGVVQFGIDVSERTKYVTYAMWISVVAVLALYALLIPPFGAMGAAVATLLAFTLRFALLYRFSQGLWPVTYRWGPPLRLAAFALLVTMLAFAIDLGGIVAKGLFGVGLLVAYLVTAWLAVLDGDDRRVVSEVIRASPRAVFARLARS